MAVDFLFFSARKFGFIHNLPMRTKLIRVNQCESKLLLHFVAFRWRMVCPAANILDIVHAKSCDDFEKT